MRRVAAGIAISIVALALGMGTMAAVERWVLASDAPAAPAPVATASVSVTPSPEPSITPSPTLLVASPSPTPTKPYFSKHTYLLDTPVSPWIVINKIRPLDPQDYVPPELSKLSGLPGGDQFLIPEAADALRALHAAADAEGAGFRISTAYRSYEQQLGIFNSYVSRWGRERAENYAARPGYSEHQTGRAVDIYTTQECKLLACFADTAAAKFVAAHAHEYGFIVRYPEGKTDVTGYDYEPWHLRYVGVELATEMFTYGPYTLEEFFELPAAPHYLD